MSDKINVTAMGAEIAAALQEYSALALDALSAAAKETATEAVAELKRTSPERTGAYKASWTKTGKKSKYGNAVLYTVYNENYRLPHLLEHEHALRRGGRTLGRVQAYPHIKPVEDAAASRLEKRIKEALGR